MKKISKFNSFSDPLQIYNLRFGTMRIDPNNIPIRTWKEISRITHPELDDYIQTDKEARTLALKFIGKDNGNLH